MQVKMMVSMSGPEVLRMPGEVHDIEEVEAKRLIQAGFAVPAEKVERSVAPPAEKRGRKKKG